MSNVQYVENLPTSSSLIFKATTLIHIYVHRNVILVSQPNQPIHPCYHPATLPTFKQQKKEVFSSSLLNHFNSTIVYFGDICPHFLSPNINKKRPTKQKHSLKLRTQNNVMLTLFSTWFIQHLIKELTKNL